MVLITTSVLRVPMRAPTVRRLPSILAEALSRATTMVPTRPLALVLRVVPKLLGPKGPFYLVATLRALNLKVWVIPF